MTKAKWKDMELEQQFRIAFIYLLLVSELCFVIVAARLVLTGQPLILFGEPLGWDFVIGGSIGTAIPLAPVLIVLYLFKS
jgi:hypothetical protein